MKKIFTFLLITLFAVSLFLPAQAGAATLSLSTNKTTYQVGDVFNIAVNINSGGNELQVVRAEITYPADLLKVQGFTLGSLFPQKSPGESIGNGKIYVGGYRLGASTNENGFFGTASFKVLKTGSAKIALTSNSRMITPEPKDIYSGGNNLTINLTGTTSQEKTIITDDKEEPKKTLQIITPSISSSTHPQESWTKNNKVNLSWTKTADNLGYVLKLDKKPLENIGTAITTKQNSYTYKDLDDGIWYFHLKAKYPNGYSKVAYYTIKIDTSPPNAPQPVIEGEINPGAENIYRLFFATTDDLSGIDYYELKFDDGEFKKAKAPYTLSQAEKETKWVTVKAVDKADNAKTGSLAIADYIKKQEDAFFQAQQEKTTLFDIQTNAAKRSWIEFYLALGAIAVIFIAIVIWIIFRKRK